MATLGRKKNFAPVMLSISLKSTSFLKNLYFVFFRIKILCPNPEFSLCIYTHRNIDISEININILPVAMKCKITKINEILK